MIVLYRYCKTVYALLVNSKAKGDTLLIKQVSEGRFAVGGVDTRKVAMQIIKPGNPPLYRLTSLPTDKKKRLNSRQGQVSNGYVNGNIYNQILAEEAEAAGASGHGSARTVAMFPNLLYNTNA